MLNNFLLLLLLLLVFIIIINIITIIITIFIFIISIILLSLLLLTVGFETNILINSKRKSNKYYYNALIKDLNSQLSMGALGILGTPSLTFPTMLEETGMDKAIQRRLMMKISNTAIQCTDYIF